MPNVTTTQTETVKLSPALKTKLLRRLRAFEELRRQAEVAKAAQARLKGEIEKLFIDADEFEALQAGVRMEGFALNHISGTTSRLDKSYILSQGWMTAAQFDEATKVTPKKPYLNIRCPGEKDE